jgi:mono/diheme cytochrome c family protein
VNRGLVILGIAVLVALSLVPLALIARARVSDSPLPRLHLVPDMDSQAKFKPQSANPMFADTRAARPAIAGTVARGGLDAGEAFATGRAGDEWVSAFPLALTEPLLRRGQERYGIYCAPCHGLSGYGDGPVSVRADRLQEGTWTPPSSFHSELVQGRPVGQLYNTIANGIRNMPAYGAQIPVEDRWAIVAYVRALQRSQHARLADVPAELRGQLR